MTNKSHFISPVYIAELVLYVSIFLVVLATSIYEILKLYSALYEIYGIVLVISIIAIVFLLRINYRKALIIISVCVYIYLSIVWGISIPYLAFIPIITVFLLFLEKKDKLAKWYLCIPFFMVVFEIFGLIPLDKLEVSPGIENLLIYLTLELIALLITFVLCTFLFYYIDDLEVALPIFQSNKNKYSVTSYVIRGMYFAIYTHFIKNYINTLWWSKRITQNDLHLFTLLGSSSDRLNDRQQSLQTIISTVTSFYHQPHRTPHLKITVTAPKAPIMLPNAQVHLVTIILFDLLHNAVTYQHGNQIELTVTCHDHKLTLRVQNGVQEHATVMKGRNVNLLDQFLRLQGCGSVTMQKSGKIMSTRLVLHISP